MSSFELNKVVGAVLLAVLAIVVIGMIGDNLVSTGGGHGGGHGEGGTMTAEAPAPKKEEPLEPVLGMLAEAEPAAGEKVFNKCKACHSVEKGGPNKIGPNLYGIVGSKPGSQEGFESSPAIKELEIDKWTYSSLNEFIHKPRDFAKGTKMTFAGLSKASDRADVIAFLRQQSDSPPPLPSQEEIDTAQKEYEAKKAEAQAPAEGHGAEKPAAAGSEGGQTAAKPAEPSKPIAELVAEADADKGKRVFNKCKACHTTEQGGPNRIGPNLHSVVDREVASHEGFSYSDALKGLKAEKWTLETLDEFIANPRGYAKGTKMTFAGIKKESDRADLLAYLKSLSN